MTNGVELPLLYAAAAVSLGLAGLGSVWTPALTWTVLALDLVGGMANLAISRPAVVTA